MSIDHRFGGIQRLYGGVGFAKIQKSHIAVIGLGGVGSWAVEALARTGVGRLTLVDFDDICLSNVNRQLHAMDGHIGQLKTKALAERVQKINPQIEVQVIDEAFSRETESLIFSDAYDGVVDALDHAYTKFDLVVACRERNIPVVLSGAAGGRLDPSQIKTGDLSKSAEDQMLAAVRKKLRQRAGFPRKGSMGVPCVYTTETPVYIGAEGCISETKPEDFNKPLDCSTGFGTVTHITGSFGFNLSYLVVREILKS